MEKLVCPLSLINGDPRCKFCADNGQCFLAALIRRLATEQK